MEYIEDIEGLTSDKNPASVGKVVSISGSKAGVCLDNEYITGLHSSQRFDVGTVLKILTPQTIIFGIISSLKIPTKGKLTGQEGWFADIDLIGEINNSVSTGSKFRRGISIFPGLGNDLFIATNSDLKVIYSIESESSITVGEVKHASSIPAVVNVDELLGKHFAVLGTTGTGKSCTVSLMFQKIIKQHPQAHIVLLDPHNEYDSAFRDTAEVISPEDLRIPYWFLKFDEIVEVILNDKEGRKEEAEILSELIPLAKARYNSAKEGRSGIHIRKSGLESLNYSVDSPIPYRISDLVALLDERMGMLDHKNEIWVHKQLKHRIEALMNDTRYEFMFGNLSAKDRMADILGRIFRVPVNGKPISILQLTGVPSEVINVVVSVLCRMTFDFGLLCEGEVPITLVCEEAHRYIPANKDLGFEPTTRSISRIAKEGRKYGISLCIVTQRPSELDPTILSQCNTVFAMRMSNEKDQEIVSAAISDIGSGMLKFLPSLGNREVIAFGESISVPMHIQLEDIPEADLPRSGTAVFSQKWQEDSGDTNLLHKIVNKWRFSGSNKASEALKNQAADERRVDLGPAYRGKSINDL